MKQLTFYLNLILIIPAILLSAFKNFIPNNSETELIFLIILGLYQVIISFGITIYSIFKKKEILVLYIIYWILVLLFFNIMIQNYFYSCILIALFNLYIHYCSFSNSKFNILNK